MTELMKKAIAKIDAEGEKGGTNQKRIATQTEPRIHAEKQHTAESVRG